MSVNTGKYRPDKSATAKKRFLNDDNFPRENTVEGRLNQANENIKIDGLYGFYRATDVKERTGYLINMQPTEIVEEDKRLISGVDYYFLEEDCTRFKVSMPYYPYLYILCRKKTEQEVSTYLLKKYAGVITKIEIVTKEDLDMPNHLIGLKQKYLKLFFANLIDLMKVKRDLNRAVKASKEREKANTYYTNLLSDMLNPSKKQDVKKITGHMENVLDMREHDVPHHMRVSIDNGIFVGLWYTVRTRGTEAPIITRREDLVEPIEPVVLAYDIETTKLPLKFPDPASDQVMMISYMIDGQGYLITNREIISSDIEDFEYTPRPEFEGLFTVFNEANEKATLMRFFDHIKDVRPHIFVSYHGDVFDWPFVEARALANNINMKEKIGFSKTKDDFFGSRAAIHMDCLHWVKRDSYLPVGSQGLKAVAKAKLRYDPVELDAEDMCRLAAEDPETLANYSVSDAVATFYLYQKYVQPFIFALCTIIPMNPDEVLRKGSGTLCESLLMVEAYRANIIFPNKQAAQLNKLTDDGHVLDVETYVGGHVEALESGVFRADIPCRFKIDPTAVDELIEGVEKALKHSIQEEEKVPMEMVTNFEQVLEEVKTKLGALKDHPIRQENPVIYHLDVGAMYPNIILTNRLQPSAIVDEATCAACDFNRPDAACKRVMEWAWRGEYLPATLGEFQRIQQQLEIETVKPADGGEPRPFHELPLIEQAALEKKRLADYCRKAYAKTKVTKVDIRKQTVCQKENSFYVDTVRAFRDRRYEYKALTKVAKQQVQAAVASGDASNIKSAKNREILYDSLQLAHKCILNSFYGYVMRKGARWHSMEMGGIVCHTGAHIIMKAREIIERVGRPLELDTDGIWCILPQSFPDNFIVQTTHPKKSKLVISYPNAVLNFMVKDKFTNDVYHELVDPVNMVYEIRSENSIFFEVDGPYRAMVLPAAKEEGKKLKKRYAVFNFDGSLAELKGFEVKRRGELQLIKIFQSSVFECFLKGETLEECYKSVAKVADYWLDVLYSKGADMPDSELFDLISENKSMSKKLEEYGAQKSTSISTAKRLAEFLGSDMVKDKGLACKYVISRKPQGAPVTERAIPLAIFQSEKSLKQHYLRKWLKDSGMQNFDIRDILDWGYYIERLGSTIQKIITIPAAFQGLSNPVPRVQYPDWLHKKLAEKNDVKKQRRITDMFKVVEKPTSVDTENSENDSIEITDIEDIASGSSPVFKRPTATVAKRKRNASTELDEEIAGKNWVEVLGPSPSFGTTREEHVEWLNFHKKKWHHQSQQRLLQRRNKKSKTGSDEINRGNRGVTRKTNMNTIHGFIHRSHRTLLETPWQIIQIAETNEPGMFRLWAMVDKQLHQIRLKVPRIFYVNTREQRGDPKPNETWRKCARILPRSRPVYNLYQYTVPEDIYQANGALLADELSKPEVEGIYETQMSLEFRAILNLGCICMVDSSTCSRDSSGEVGDTFSLEQLQFKSIAVQSYLESEVKYIFLYHHWSSNQQRAIWGLFLSPSKRAYIFVQDTVKTNRMPNLNTLYNTERSTHAESSPGNFEAPDTMHFEVKTETSVAAICRSIQAALKAYKNEMKGATILAVQTAMSTSVLTSEMPLLNDFPIVNTRVQDPDNLFNTLEWQRVGASTMVGHYLKSETVLSLMAEQCRYFHAPIGNIPADPSLFGADLFYARNLQKHNFVLWYSTTERPDLGGSENDDNRLLTDFEESASFVSNYPGVYSSVCVELDIESLAVNTLLQSHRVNDIDGTSSYVAFHTGAQVSLQEMVTGESSTATIPSYDETALCNASFKVLRSMVGTWLKDVTIHKNIYADCQLMDFYRWLRSPSARLYDPALRRTLHNYMKKLFVQLVAEFMRLGAIIVFANFNKIVICTKKRSVEAALGHINYIVATIRNKELFHSINITYESCWLYLVWLDLPNHAGVLGKLPKDLQEEEETYDETDDDDDAPEIIMNWNLMEILPNDALCRDHFSTIIAGYISAIYRHITVNEPESGTPRRRRRDSTISQTQTAPLGLGALQNSAEFAKKLIAGEMSQKLFQVVQKIHKRLPEKIVTFKENPNLNLGGAESMKINPSLELIKAICKILSLDKELVDEVNDLKRNLLRLIGVGSFNDKAEWKDPCVSFLLPEVICKTCNHTRDIDLCKDTSVQIVDGIYSWKCPMCETCYDNAEIEFALLDILYRRTMGYVLQDLQCRKCSQIKRGNVNELCKCAGTFKNTINRQEMIQTVKVLESISKKCGMALLTDAIDNTHLMKET